MLVCLINLGPSKLLKFVNSVFGPSILPGVLIGEWYRLLKSNRFKVSPIYTPRAVAIALLSIANSVCGSVENAFFNKQIHSAEVRSPLFILGHWRSGTTYLHQLLSLDEQFAAPSLMDVVFPHSCLTVNCVAETLFKRVRSGRPSDQMALSLESPYEDEFAICAMSLLSAQLSMVFPRREKFFDRFVTFQDATEDEVEQFQTTLLRFYQKLTVKYGKPLLIKSPAHTGRIRLLLELFPDARFIHLVRDPYRVFQSTLQTMQRSLKNQTLQSIKTPDYKERTIRQYTRLYNAYLSERELIPKGRLVDVRYEELVEHPANVICEIYESLGIVEFSNIEDAISEQTGQRKSHRRNQFAELTNEDRQRVSEQWKSFFSAFNYPS